MLKRVLLAVAGLLLSCAAAEAANCPGSGYTYSFSPNTTADASQVNSNFSYILSCANTNLAPIASPDFSGAVGIGVTPTIGGLQLLQAANNSNSGVTVEDSTSTRTARLWADTNNAYLYAGASGTIPLILNTTGAVGIGTAGPVEQLTVTNTGANVLGVYRNLDVTSSGAAAVFINLGARNGSAFAAGSQIWGVLNNPATTGYIVFATLNAGSLTEKMRIDPAGDVGIGTTSPAAALDIQSANSALSFRVFENGNTTTPLYYSGGSGTINGVATGANSAATMLTVNKDSGTGRSINAAGTINASGADYAEYFRQAAPGSLTQGEVVALDARTGYIEAASAASSNIVGVVSTKPGFVGNDLFDPKQPKKTSLVGLVGQVPTRVSLEGGAIEIGDRIAASSTPGVARKAGNKDRAVGIAMSAWKGSGVGSIIVLLQPEMSSQLTPALIETVAALQSASQNEVEANTELRAENAAIEARLDRLEAALKTQHRQASNAERILRAHISRS